jgi:hypothetical protein
MYQLFHPWANFNEDISNWDITNATNMSMIFHSSGLSTTNYDKILTGWAQQTVKPNVELGAGTIHYCNSGAARESLINNHNWNIVDLGLDCSTASLDNQNQLDISMYPNPASDILFIDGNYSQLKVIVYDILGKQVMNKPIKNTMNISQLEKGIYILQLSDGTKQNTQRIIKY